jgi:hypothetical protein
MIWRGFWEAHVEFDRYVPIRASGGSINADSIIQAAHAGTDTISANIPRNNEENE